MAARSEPGDDHHYVPQFYLRGFRDNKQKTLWVYERGATAPRESNPKAEASYKDYYAFTDLDDRDKGAEKALSQVEGVVAPIFRSLRQRQYKMSAQDVGELFSFMRMMFVRVPAYRNYVDTFTEREINFRLGEMMKSPEGLAEFKRYYEATNGKPLVDHEALRQALSGQFVSNQKSTMVNLLFTFHDAAEIGKYFVNNFSYDLYYAPAGSYFVTSDNPIATIGPFLGGLPQVLGAVAATAMNGSAAHYGYLERALGSVLGSALLLLLGVACLRGASRNRTALRKAGEASG